MFVVLLLKLSVVHATMNSQDIGLQQWQTSLALVTAVTWSTATS